MLVIIEVQLPVELRVGGLPVQGDAADFGTAQLIPIGIGPVHSIRAHARDELVGFEQLVQILDVFAVGLGTVGGPVALFWGSAEGSDPHSVDILWPELLQYLLDVASAIEAATWD